ncbi:MULTISPECIES: acyl-CoA desaturase [Chitinophagaceae]|uniref:acyl-CoA desaturase n=1 Tax=Chitinophagaceae TaxID=563835 RepID=UPI000DEF4943|nr:MULTISPECIES: acyl-CoA desaturase [Chitinophagaceae]RPD51864.1 acyl-CoA desaturase [Paracnuella aquatica]
MVFVIVFFIAHWYLSLFSQTFFQHRYAAHRAFTMTKGWERFFFFFAWLTQGSSYLSPRAYGIMHRMHHAYTDTELDPHSPAYDKNIFAMMWRTKNIYSDILSEKTKVEPRFTKNVPTWKSFDIFASSWPSRVFWIGVYVALYLLFAPSAWFLLLVPVHAVMGPLHGVIINWYAHKYGEVNFETDNTSKNLFKLDWLMFGEGYHNNHHVHPSRSNFAVEKGEFDLCYPIIKVLAKLNIIRMNTAPALAAH